MHETLVGLRRDYIMALKLDQTHKSHNAPVSYPTMHNSEQKHFVQNGALWDVERLHCGICELICSSSTKGVVRRARDTAAQWAHDAIITSSLRQNDVADVVLT